MSNLALISPDSAFEWRLKFALGSPQSAELRHWREDYLRIDPSKVVEEVAEGPIDVVCLGPGLDVDIALEVAGAFDRDRPEICIVLIAQPTGELWQQAMQSGVRDVVSPDSGPDDLRAAVARAVETARRRRDNLTTPVQPNTPGSRVISIISPKGGSGKTTVATNLAIELTRRSSDGVAVVDLDLQFGDIAAALQLRPEHSIADVARANTSVDPTVLKVFLTKHTSGLWALCSPESPADADEISTAHVSQTLSLLGTEFEFVVVDTSAGLHEATLAALDVSTDLVIVCPMDVAGIRSLRKELDVLDRMGVAATRRHLVLNRADSRVGIAPSDVEEVLGMTVDVAIPSSRSVPLSMNEGIPLVESNPRSPVAVQLQQLADHFCKSLTTSEPSNQVATPAKVGWLSRYRKETK